MAALKHLILLSLSASIGLCEEKNITSIEVGVEETAFDKSRLMGRLRASAYPAMVDIPVESVSPPGSLRDAAPVTSTALAQLELSPMARLHGSPGGTEIVQFLLTNVDSRKRSFALALTSHGSKGAVTFPGHFLSTLSESRVNLEPNETARLNISIALSREVPWGTNKTFSLEVQPEGVTDSGPAKLVVRRFYFVVGQPDHAIDEWAPECKVLRNSVHSQCEEVAKDAKMCNLHTWVGELEFQDTGSGLRSLSETPSFYGANDTVVAYFSHDNFVIGSHLQANFFAQVSCCIPTIFVRVTDVFGNENVCSVGLESLKRNAGEEQQIEVQLGSTTSTIVIVVVVLLVLALLASVGVAFYFRRKRNAELAEMRASPQER